MTDPEPTADDLAAVAEGALSVAQACAFSGESRPTLYAWMRAELVDWYHSGTDRRITRASLVRQMARMRAARRRARG